MPVRRLFLAPSKLPQIISVDDPILLTVAPGYISTEMNTALIADPTRSRQILERIPSGRWGTPEDFTSAILFLAGKGSDYVCGECVTVRPPHCWPFGG
jgi:hypothetical protein